jgi:hypothetical protein
MKRLNPAIATRTSKSARSATKTAANIANAQAQAKKTPIGGAATAAQGHWIGAATQQDHELLWRLHG